MQTSKGYSQEIGTPNQRTKELIAQGDALFSKRMSLMSIWQEIADNFYPERADFTALRSMGYRQFANLLTTSSPIIMRRDLGGLFSSMLRPMEKSWFSMRTMRPEEEDDGARVWLERATMIMKRAMYDRDAQFVKATKAGDQDFAAFGQCVLTVELNPNRDALLYRCWHLRDIAWSEDSTGQVGNVHHNWRPTRADLCRLYPETVNEKVKAELAKEPQTQINCRIMVCPADDYDLSTQGLKGEKRYVHLVVDTDNNHVMEFKVTFSKKYIVPRWQVVSNVLWGTQYALSPCTVAALPDARLLQSMTLTLLEAGEKTVNPPLVAVEEAIRSDVSVFAGGITYVDAEYDERLGEVLRPITQNNNIQLGIELIDRTKEAIASAFYLNKISLPPADGGDKMTAFEASQRVGEYIRNAMPLFEPIEYEYNAAVCEETFGILFREGAFGPLEEIPESLSGKDIHFSFISPLAQAEEEMKAQKFLNAKGLVAASLDLDPTASSILNIPLALRDSLYGSAPASWLRSEEEVQAVQAKAAEQQQVSQTLATMQQGADVANTLGQAGQTIAGGPATGVR